MRYPVYFWHSFSLISLYSKNALISENLYVHGLQWHFKKFQKVLVFWEKYEFKKKKVFAQIVVLSLTGLRWKPISNMCATRLKNIYIYLGRKGQRALWAKNDTLQKWFLFANCIALPMQGYKIKVNRMTMIPFRKYLGSKSFKKTAEVTYIICVTCVSWFLCKIHKYLKLQSYGG